MECAPAGSAPIFANNNRSSSLALVHTCIAQVDSSLVGQTRSTITPQRERANHTGESNFWYRFVRNALFFGENLEKVKTDVREEEQC
jgi:hypothetical protein